MTFRNFAKFLVVIVGVVVAVWAAATHFVPAPPRRIAIATAFKGGAYELFGNRYKEILARSGVDLDVRITEGVSENLKLVNDPSSGIQVAFLQGGNSTRKESPDLLSLGRINYQPFWIFKRSTETVDDVRGLKGRRIAVGPVGSPTRALAEMLLGISGATADPDLLTIQGQPAVNGLINGTVDAAFFPGPLDSPIIQNLLRNPALKPMDFPRADGLIKSRPYLVRLILPAGSIDIARDVPPQATTIVGTTNAIVARKELHPGIIYLLAQALVETHGNAGFFEASGEFPTQTDPEYPFAESAQDFYKNGPGFLNRYLPFWAVFYVQRLLAILLTAAAIIIPLFNVAPKLYNWFWQDRMMRLYRRLRGVEEALLMQPNPAELQQLQIELENIQRAARALPRRNSDLFIHLGTHIGHTRTRLDARRAGQQPSEPSLLM